MNDKRAPSRNNGRRADPRHGGKDARLLLIGWIFLGVVLILAVAAIALLLPDRSAPRGTDAAPAPTALPAGSSGGSAFAAETTAPPLTYAEGTGGRLVDVGRIRCDFTEPESITFGVLRGVDTSAMAPTLAANAAASGWGTLTYSYSSDTGYLLLRAEDHPVLNGDDFDRQEAFLASAQPENLARTFMDNVGLIPLLRDYGITLTNYAENNDGMITFRGRGQDAQTECTIQFSFLFTGAFNQAVLRGTFLDGAVTTDKVLTLKKAAQSAVTWGSAESGTVDVVSAELRSIRGLPFYVLTCSDGTVAYALAVPESELDAASGTRQVYEDMMRNGIQEYIEVPGAAY